MLRILKAIIGIDDDDRNPSTTGEIRNEARGDQEFHGTNNNTGYMTGDNNGKAKGSNHSSKRGGNKARN
ncbi:hypothetical protein O6P43_021843 [Quillaja saponaria]|uniref:Uncharacterized protein n=1 Tax=Quillaja saponaria TaxID=32244 RepID=A0AAD7PHK8_QUISA|nr:hypothetical protein O6P43_021843 [Quillaja saponaria]